MFFSGRLTVVSYVFFFAKLSTYQIPIEMFLIKNRVDADSCRLFTAFPRVCLSFPGV
jgi:hypothetical protein